MPPEQCVRVPSQSFARDLLTRWQTHKTVNVYVSTITNVCIVHISVIWTAVVAIFSKLTTTLGYYGCIDPYGTFLWQLNWDFELTRVWLKQVPMPLIIKLRVSWKRKIALCAMLSSGIFVITAAIIRIVFVLQQASVVNVLISLPCW